MEALYFRFRRGGKVEAENQCRSVLSYLGMTQTGTNFYGARKLLHSMIENRRSKDLVEQLIQEHCIYVDGGGEPVNRQRLLWDARKGKFSRVIIPNMRVFAGEKENFLSKAIETAADLETIGVGVVSVELAMGLRQRGIEYEYLINWQGRRV